MIKQYAKCFRHQNNEKIPRKEHIQQLSRISKH